MRRVLILAAAMLLLVPGHIRSQQPDPSPDHPVRILFLGDSLTAGYGLPPGAAFPHQVARRLTAEGYDIQVIQAGVSGDTTSGGLARLDWLLNDPAGPPDAAVVALGANDGLMGLDPASMEANLDTILGVLAQRGIPTLLAGMLAMANLGPEYTQRYNAVFPRVAQRFGVRFAPFLLDKVAMRPSLNQADGIHPNEAGARKVAETILPQVRALVEDVLDARAAE